MARRKGISEDIKRDIESLLASGVSRNEVADRLNVSRAAVYKHFPVRKERPEEARELLQAMASLVEESKSTLGNMAEVLRQAGDVMTRAGIEIGRNDARWSRLEELVAELRDALGD